MLRKEALLHTHHQWGGLQDWDESQADGACFELGTGLAINLDCGGLVGFSSAGGIAQAAAKKEGSADGSAQKSEQWMSTLHGVMGWLMEVFEDNTKLGAVITAPWLVKCCSDVLARPQIVGIAENGLLLLERCCAGCWDPAFVIDED
jgi:hypothetical protein